MKKIRRPMVLLMKHLPLLLKKHLSQRGARLVMGEGIQEAANPYPTRDSEVDYCTHGEMRGQLPSRSQSYWCISVNKREDGCKGS